MNEFDFGFVWGKLFVSWVINDDFFGIAVRIDKETEIEEVNAVYHITIQVGYGQLTIGFTS